MTRICLSPGSSACPAEGVSLDSFPRDRCHRGRWIDRLGTSIECITWNALNRLPSASKNGALLARFRYDPLGRRVVKSTHAKVTTYTNDGANILRENATVGGVTTTSYYVHGPGIDEPLAKETGGVMTDHYADGLGSIVEERVRRER